MESFRLVTHRAADFYSGQMPACLQTHIDLPALEDQLGRRTLLRRVANEIATGKPPMVLGIHGDWGAGKTSFLCQLEQYLSGRCTIIPATAPTAIDYPEVFTVWFEAWRYQNESNPVVALLHEICRQLPAHEKIKESLGKGLRVLLRGVMNIVQDVSFEVSGPNVPGAPSGKAGVKLQNPAAAVRRESDVIDQERMAVPLGTDRVRTLLTDAIGQLLGKPERRLCVIIDDLDRCHPEVALRFLEGIRIHLSLPQCVFVLGVHRRQLEQSVGRQLAELNVTTNPTAEAAEYLEKLCAFSWNLPMPGPAMQQELFRRCLADPTEGGSTLAFTCIPEEVVDKIVANAKHFRCLPANSRKIKALANSVRQLAALAWYDGVAVQHFLPVPLDDAHFLLAAASIYQFHPEVLRFLQADESCYTAFVDWLKGTPLPVHSPFGAVLANLRRSSERPPEMTKAADTAATAGSALPEEVRIFPDPVHLAVFRVRDLLRAAVDNFPDTAYPILARYLSLPQ